MDKTPEDCDVEEYYKVYIDGEYIFYKKDYYLQNKDEIYKKVIERHASARRWYKKEDISFSNESGKDMKNGTLSIFTSEYFDLNGNDWHAEFICMWVDGRWYPLIDVGNGKYREIDDWDSKWYEKIYSPCCNRIEKNLYDRNTTRENEDVIFYEGEKLREIPEDSVCTKGFPLHPFNWGEDFTVEDLIKYVRENRINKG